MLAIGTLAPDFILSDSHGHQVRLADFRNNQHVVLYFYPEDDTPSCTLEAQAFSTSKADYDALETAVLGVSPDSATSHAKFCNKYGLLITLLSDPKRDVIEQYGVWGKKEIYGRTYMGVVRSTFLIDKQGFIRYKWSKVKSQGHDQAVLEAVKNIVGND